MGAHSVMFCIAMIFPIQWPEAIYPCIKGWTVIAHKATLFPPFRRVWKFIPHRQPGCATRSLHVFRG
eukprot:11210179-Prorocentrum_lima.AAC.1